MQERLINGRRVRGLTLHRPWAWAFTNAGKRVENRSWPPPKPIIGGYLALHAGMKFDKDVAADMREGLYGAAACGVPDESSHPAGFIVALARLEGYHGVKKGQRDGTYELGPFVWRTPQVFALPTPIQCRGFQGLWKLGEPWHDALEAQLDEHFDLALEDP